MADFAPVPSEPWIAALRRKAAERRAQRQAAIAVVATDPRAALRSRITEWWDTLPPDARASSYFMEDLVRLIGGTPQQLGMALRELSWRCERRWRPGQPYRHYWLPLSS